MISSCERLKAHCTLIDKPSLAGEDFDVTQLAKPPVPETTNEASALMTSEHRFRTLFEQAPFSIQIVSPDGRTLKVNPAWKRLLDVSDELVENYILKEYNILQDPQLSEKGILPYLLKAFAGEATWSPPVRYDPAELGKPGRPRWLEAFMFPVLDPSGALSEVVLMHDDVTDRVEADAEREKLIARMQEAIRTRDAFLSMASHELRTPLTAMSLQVQLRKKRLEEGNETPLDRDSVEKLLDLTSRQIDRLSRLVEDMFDVSRLATDKLVLQYESFDLGQLVGELLAQFAGQLKASGCSYQLQIAPGVVGYWDRSRIRRLVANLLTNAMKHGEHNPIHILCDSHNGQARLIVRDHGIGIADDDLERIFERFERVVGARSDGGLGLGLYISRQIAEAHDGTIHAEAADGGGTRFVVMLPLSHQVDQTKSEYEPVVGELA